MYRIIGADQREYGPLSKDQIREWLVQGRITPESKVQAEGNAEWRALSELPEFSDMLKNRPPELPAGAPPLTQAKPARTSRIAIWSLVLGILGLPTAGLAGLLGLVLGIVAMVKIRNSHGAVHGFGIALSGTIVSGLTVVLLPIMAIMLAMLLPALASAKSKAQAVVCMNNMKQLSLGLRIYADSNKDCFPQGTNWCDAIQTYVPESRTYKCAAGDPSLRCHYAFNAKLAGVEVGKIEAPPGRCCYLKLRADGT